MNKSIYLLSSMSPKVKTKAYAKGSSILALKKCIRRSLNCDKSSKTLSNEEVNIVDQITSTSSYETLSSGKSNNCQNVIDETVIEISDSSSESEEENAKAKTSEQVIEAPTPKETIKVKTPIESTGIQQPTPVQIINQKSPKKIIREVWLSEEKFKYINRWIDNINLESGEETKFSEVSTIYGDGADNFQSKEAGVATNSTFISPDHKRFDECFKESSKETEVPPSFITQTEKLLQNRLEVSINAFKTSIDNYFANDVCEEPMLLDNILNVRKSLSNVLLSQKNLDLTDQKECERPESSGLTLQAEISSVLDSIYGNSWRHKEDQILPKTEPRKNRKNVNVLYSERKPVHSSLRKKDNVQSQPINLPRTSLKFPDLLTDRNVPDVRRLKISEFCHSDIDSSDSPTNSYHITPRAIFSNSDNALKNFGENKIPNNDEEKENFDVSDLGISLEERIRKKIHNIPEVQKNSIRKKANKTEVKKNYVLKDVSTGTNSRTKKTDKLLKEVPKGKNPKTKKTDVLLKEISTGNNPRTKNTNELLKEVPTGNNPRTKKTNELLKEVSTGKNPITKKTDKKTSNNYSSDRSNLSISSSDEEEWNRRLSMITYKIPTDGSCSFLASLSKHVSISNCDMAARIYRDNFKCFKEELLTKLFAMYNEKVFDNSIPLDTPLEWSDRMRGTAGFCYCRKVTYTSGKIERTTRIVLATKVIDSADRLRDTLIHEMCHAAAWIVNCVSDGHGKYWKAWAFKAMKIFPELPPIQRCHNYVINTKYTYKCMGCDYSIGRHTKSLDIERKRCGYCMGKFEVLLNKVSKKGVTRSVPATPKKEPNGFALFVKENYGSVKKSNLKHGEVMKKLGQMFQDFKIDKQ